MPQYTPTQHNNKKKLVVDSVLKVQRQHLCNTALQ
jgi:hypothetical protein